MERETITIADSITQSKNDSRYYRHVVLKNGLSVLLVHDDVTEKASACVNVKVGSISDPEMAIGLAHFLEHLLFLGTTNFPEENQYSKYISEHYGSSNAFTTLDETVIIYNFKTYLTFYLTTYT